MQCTSVGLIMPQPPSVQARPKSLIVCSLMLLGQNRTGRNLTHYVIWEISFQQTTVWHLQYSRAVSKENECNP